MHIRCPHCRNSIEVVDGDQLQDLTCPSCGSSFNLLPDETVSRQTATRKTLGRFELVERIGIGAFGEVWAARDSELDRIVAIKLPRKGQLTIEETESFLREARLAARLHHPSIVAVHEVGKEEDQLFIVSDYVHGLTLADWLTGKQPSPEEAAELCAKIAEAVQHAHKNGVIHRDLKPSNIMLDDDGQPHIMDFGLAKRDAGEITMTVEGRILGTPAYMSPEQAKGEGHNADQRSDVYSLGAIFFELLTGELPFRGNARMLIHQAINEEPPGPRKFNNQVPADLDTVCLKCLEKDPDKRYQTAGELALDLRRFLVDEPIEARPVSRLERGWRWCKRNPVVAGLTGTVAALVLSGLVVTVSLLILANIEAEQRRRQLYVADMNVAWMAWEDSNPERAVELLRQHVPNGSENDLRSFDWYCLWKVCHRHYRASDQIPLPAIGIELAYSPDGTLLATSHPNGGSVTVWNVESKEMVRQIGTMDPGTYDAISFAFLADGQTMIYTDRDGSLFAQRVDSETRREIDFDSSILQLAVSPLSGNVITVDTAGCTIVWDPLASKELNSFDRAGNDVAAMAVAADESILVTGHNDGRLVVWDLMTREQNYVRHEHMSRVNCVTISQDGQWIASGGLDNTVKIWDAETGEKLAEFGVHADDIRGVAFSPDSTLLATLSRDQTVRLWDTESFRELETLRGGAGTEGVVFSPDGNTLAVTGEEDVITLWALPDLTPRQTLWCKGGVGDLSLSDDGRYLAAARGHSAEDHVVTVWDLDRKMQETEFCSLNGALYSTDVDHWSRILATGGRGTIQLWRVDSGAQVGTLSLPGEDVMSVAFSPNGKLMAAGTRTGKVSIWDMEDHHRVFDLRAHGAFVSCVTFSRNGELLATASWDYSAKVWDANSGELVRELPQHPDLVLSVAFSPSDKHLATGCFDSKIRVWDLPVAENMAPNVFRGHGWEVDGVFFSTDGKTIISAGGDRTVRTWDLATGQQRCVLGKHLSRVYGAAFSADGKTLATGSNDGAIHLWRAATPEEVDSSPWWRDVMAKGR